MKTGAYFLSLVLLLCVLTSCAEIPDSSSGLESYAQQIENAIGEEWDKQWDTKIYQLTYSNGTGSEIFYYLCLTTYYEAEPRDVSGVDLEALEGIAAWDTMILENELEISGFPAALYVGDGRNYLCWTASAEVSGVLEYAPAEVSLEQMVRMAESIYDTAE